MKNNLIKLACLIITSIISTAMISESTIDNLYVIDEYNEFELIYGDVWGSIYHAEVRQCDDSPTITGDGSIIDINNASKHRWIAISQEMLNCEYRQNLLNDSTSNLYKGAIKYGDTVWIKSPYPEINGWWIVHDTKNKRYQRSIDFLQTKGDYSLFKNNKEWSGKFDSIRIYKKNNFKLT